VRILQIKKSAILLSKAVAGPLLVLVKCDVLAKEINESTVARRLVMAFGGRDHTTACMRIFVKIKDCKIRIADIR